MKMMNDPHHHHELWCWMSIDLATWRAVLLLSILGLTLLYSTGDYYAFVSRDARYRNISNAGHRCHSRTRGTTAIRACARDAKQSSLLGHGGDANLSQSRAAHLSSQPWFDTHLALEVRAPAHMVASAGSACIESGS